LSFAQAGVDATPIADEGLIVSLVQNGARALEEGHLTKYLDAASPAAQVILAFLHVGVS
jgi:hypothetical protein